MLVGTIVSTVAGVVLGGLVTWFAAWYYFKKASEQLVTESKRLKLTTELVLYKLQYPGAKTQLKRDAQGDVIGLIVEAEARL